jgi:glycosyltransferase involved in cell wall biosynthesis
MPLRIALIIPTLDRCGAEKQLTLLATGLPSRDFEVHVCALTRGGPLESSLRAAGVPVTVIGKRRKLDVAAYLRLRRYLRDLRPDIAHTWLFAANSYGRLAAWQAGVPIIIAGERCVDPWKRWHELAIDRLFARFTRRIVTNSAGVRDFYVAQGLPAEKFTLIPNGIAPVAPVVVPADSSDSALVAGAADAADSAGSADSARSAVESDSAGAAAVRQAARERLLGELGLPATTRLVGAVGRLWPQKRYKDLIWAAELLRWPHPDAHLVIVGEGPQGARLARYTHQIGIETHVHFLGARDDVPRLLPALDCFWLASGYEGQSNALMEAMAAGLPVVVSDIPGNRDLVVDGESGLLVPPGNKSEFARRTRRLFDDREFAQMLGRNARRRMEDEFSVRRMIERHARLYSELASDIHASGPNG